MTDIVSLYQQLESLAEQNQIDIETLIINIKQMDMGELVPSESGVYWESVISAIGLITNTFDWDKGGMQQWFEYVDKIFSYDVGLILSYEDDNINLRYANMKTADKNGELEVGQKWTTSSIPMLEDLLDNLEVTLVEDEELGKLTMLVGVPTMRSAVMMPVINNGGLIGVIVFMSLSDQYNLSISSKMSPFIHVMSGLLQNLRLVSTVYQSTDELASLYHATSVLFRADNLQDFAAQITEVVIRTFDYADCGLLIVDNTLNEIIRIKRAGPEVMQPVTTLTIDGRGLVPKAIREGRMVYEPDVRHSSDYVIGDERSLCELVVPLKTTQGILGVLDFQSMDTYAFSERDQRIIVAFAERVAPALENVLLYDQLRRHTIELEQRFVQRTFELQKTKEQLETILKNSPDAIVLLDSNGIIKQANLSWLSMVGHSMRDVIGKSLSEFLPLAQRQIFHDVLNKTLIDELENDITVELPYQNRSTPIEVEISLAPIIDDHEKRGEVVCNIRDMTQHKQTERLLREALLQSEELSQLKMNFVTMASHEFRTPLTTILSSSDIVAQYQHRLSNDKVKNHMLKIQREVDYLNNLIDDILLIGRSGEEGFKATYGSVNLVKLIREIVRRVRKTDHNEHSIHAKVAQNCTTIIMDEKLLTYILDNLLTNACKYSEIGTSILIDVSLGQELHIVVKDAGIGIPKKDHAMLFESFYRGSNVGNIRGTGIGLAIVHQALVALNGRIRVMSQENLGTTITISLPVPTELPTLPQ